MEDKNKYPFNRGYEQVMKKNLTAVKEDIMKALDITTDQSWRRYKNGHANLMMWQKEAIEAVFKNYGITEVWGNDGESNKSKE